ncbi:hypothetical protein [Woodsholea maritima]|uniref:hypothetical protein n=1 Tax=Woodsholea maritima TaxID=240237 RepID=UPI000366509D|nr:hypothetical protein [Woodsholea maritima]
MLKFALIAGVSAVAFASGAIAQDFTAAPAFGEAHLSSGFLPDPHEVHLVAGGSLDASSINSSCSGSIANAPDFRLHFEGDTIYIGVRSSDDTTLVVNGPDGNWHCVDDVDGLNPFLGGSYGAGQYDIWVGTYGGGTSDATLYITEYSTPQ